MFFLMRVAFWLCIVFVLLPTGGSKPSEQTSSASSDFSIVEAVSAATATVSDMRHFCERQPSACAVGSQAAVAFGQRAQAGAKMVYEMINERTAAQETGSVGEHNASQKPAAAKASQNTLTSKDLVVPWHGPQPPHNAATAAKKPV
jgi:hypothetical protein